MKITQQVWEHIFDCISRSKTILFIGPSIAVDDNGNSLQTQFFKDYYEKQNDEILSFHERDQLFVFKDDTAKNLASGEINKFYKQDFVPELYKKIAKIPFHCIVLLSPELTLTRMFDAQGLYCKPDYFNFMMDFQGQREYTTDQNEETKSTYKPSIDEPLIYSLFGVETHRDTFILDHQDLFNYLRSYFTSHQSLMQVLLTQLKEADNLIFIGVDFNRWYMHLIIYDLLITSWKQKNILKEDGRTKYFSPVELTNDNFRLFEERYKIKFVNENIGEFIDTIYKYFEAPERDQLRKQTTKKVAQRNYEIPKIKQLLNESFDDTQLKSFCQSYFTPLYNNFSDGQGKDDKIRELIDYIGKNNQFEFLIGLLEVNSHAKYEQYKPYWQ